MRVLALPRYSPLGASSRLRMFQFLPWLREAGIDIDVSPLLPERYLQDLYEGRRSTFTVARSYARRLAVLAQSRRYDVVWLEKELLPWVPIGFLEWMRGRAKIVIDYDDPVFHSYDLHASSFVRRHFGTKIDREMAVADVVVAGNDYLARRAMDAGASRVEVIPTVIDLDRYPHAVPHRETRSLTFGWIGSPATASYLRLIADDARRIAEKHPDVRFLAIGAGPHQVTGTVFEAVGWSEESEVSQVMSLDVGLMPLLDGPWERGKCGYKLIQYMACGIPVVATDVGVNRSIVGTQSGALISAGASWVGALERMILDPGYRLHAGREGRERVESSYCLQVQAPRLADILQSLA